MTPKEFAAAKHRWLDIVEADRDRVRDLAFRLAYVLAGFFNAKSADAWPSQETLANRLGVTERAIQKCLDQLSAGGYLITEMGKGRGNTSRYQPTLNGERLFTLSNHKRRTAIPERANGCSEKGERSFVQNLLYEPALKTLSKTGERDLFEEFWKIYPRKRSKRAAQRLYTTVVNRGQATHQALMVGVKHYAAECQGRADQHMKDPANWLKDGNWADQLPRDRRDVSDGRI